MASERAERKNILLRTSQRGGSCVCHPGHKAQLWFRRSRAPCSLEPTPDAPASGPSTVLSYSLAFGLSMGAVAPHTLLAQLSPQCFPTAQGSLNVSVQLTPSPTEPGASGMGLLPQQGWAQSFKMHKARKAAASWWITSMVLRWTEFISYDLKILFLWRSIMVTCDFNDFTDD